MNTTQILKFLANLSQNNNKTWFDANKAEYEIAKQSFSDIVETFIAGIANFDSSVDGLLAKQCIFRINRDIRFSKDKIPYKDWLGAYIVHGGRHGIKHPRPPRERIWRAGYYVHLQPGGSIIAGGLHLPNTECLTATRQAISDNGNTLNKIINNRKFKEVWGEFLGESLKKAPRDFSPEDKYINLIKLKSFDLVYNYNDKDIRNCENFIADALAKFRLLKPVNDFFNEAIG